AGITVDGDINDRFAPLISNNDPANPQVISNTATVHGFASARGTTGNAAEENFYFSADRNDYFCASLQAGQRIQMQVVDFSANDLDLFLFDTSGNGISASQTNGEFEEVVAATAGDYLIHVNAFSGISKYVLQVLPAVEPPAEPADIVPGEVVVQYEPAASIARFSTGTYQGPQVIRLNTGARALSSLAEPDPLQSFNPELYEKIQTLIEAKRISQQEGVKWAEPNYIVKPTLIPNDSLYTQQWHYPAINLPQAWDISTGEAAPEVIVAVIDTGVY